MDGIVFNIIFIVYVFLAGPMILKLSDRVLNWGDLSPVLGIILLSVLILEAIAAFYKFPAIYKRIKKTSNGSLSIPKLSWLLLLSHSLISYYLIIVAFESLGFEPMTNHILGKFFFTFLFLKELPICYVLLYPDKFKSKHVSRTKEFFADAFYTIFACISYTVAWEVFDFGRVLDLSTSFVGKNIFGILALAFFTLILFLFAFAVFSSIRIPYFIEEYYLAFNLHRKIYLFFSLAIGFLMMLYPLL